MWPLDEAPSHISVIIENFLYKNFFIKKKMIATDFLFASKNYGKKKKKKDKTKHYHI